MQPEYHGKPACHGYGKIEGKNEERGWLVSKIDGEIVTGELTQNGYGKILVRTEIENKEEKCGPIRKNVWLRLKKY